MKWSEIILGLLAAIGPILSVALYYRQTKKKKELEIDHEKVGIQLDEATRNNLIQAAATVNQEYEQKREAWWTDQIKILRDEVEAERQLSHRRFRRLNQLEDWATLHVAWDRKAWNKILETDPTFIPPPQLPEEIIQEVRQRWDVGDP